MTNIQKRIMEQTPKDVISVLESISKKRFGCKDIVFITDKATAFNSAIMYDKIAETMPNFNYESHISAYKFLNMLLNEHGMEAVEWQEATI